jgi:hypothetical protein
MNVGTRAGHHNVLKLHTLYPRIPPHDTNQRHILVHDFDTISVFGSGAFHARSSAPRTTVLNETLNLLKPTGYVMHHQCNIQ